MRDVVNTAIDLDAFAECVTHAAAGERPPLWLQLFADALSSLDAHDARMAMLSAAIAVESVAGDHLDALYAARLAGAPGPDIRPLSVGALHSDPIYEYLRAASNFRLYLHERPLYLSGRSLLVERKQDYDFLLRLYATRNKIAHTGGASGGEGASLRVDVKNARDAIAHVGNAIRWFGYETPALDLLACVDSDYDNWFRDVAFVSYGTRSVL